MKKPDNSTILRARFALGARRFRVAVQGQEVALHVLEGDGPASYCTGRLDASGQVLWSGCPEPEVGIAAAAALHELLNARPVDRKADPPPKGPPPAVRPEGPARPAYVRGGSLCAVSRGLCCVCRSVRAGWLCQPCLRLVPRPLCDALHQAVLDFFRELRIAAAALGHVRAHLGGTVCAACQARRKAWVCDGCWDALPREVRDAVDAAARAEEAARLAATEAARAQVALRSAG